MSLYFLHCFALHWRFLLRQCATSSSSLKKSDSHVEQLLTFFNTRCPTVYGRASHPIAAQALWNSVTPRKISSNT